MRTTNKPYFQPTPQQTEYAEQLSLRGYRRVSNKYGIVARVDRADWLQFMAQKMGRSVADFFKVDEPNMLADGWPDHYRRVYSQDKLELNPVELGRLIAASDHDPIGFIDDDGTEKRQCGIVCMIHGHFEDAVRCPKCIAPDLLLKALTPVMSEIRDRAKFDDRWSEVAHAYDMLTREAGKRRQPGTLTAPIHVEAEQCKYCKSGRLPSGATCGLCDGKGNVVKEVPAINFDTEMSKRSMRGRRK